MTPVGGFGSGSRSPTLRYRQIDLASRVEGSTPHMLVAMLYEELSVVLDVFARAIEGDSRRIIQQHERADSILHALEAGLDHVGGGELALSLGGIYRQMRRRLLAARGGDCAALAEVRAGVKSLAAAWSAIA